MRSAVGEEDAIKRGIQNYCSLAPKKDPSEIGFLVFAKLAVGHTAQSLHAFESSLFRCLAKSGIDKYSIYFSSEGSGTNIIRGSVSSGSFLEKFTNFHDLIIGSDFLEREKFSTESCIVLNNAIADIADFRDDLKLGATGPGPQHELEFLYSEESQYLELKGSLSLSIGNLIKNKKVSRDKEAERRVLIAICGMLNTPENGQVVIGALEAGDPLHEEAAKELDLPREGKTIIFGLEAGDFDVVGMKGKTPHDRFSLHLKNLIAERILPSAQEYIRIKYLPVHGRTLCVLQVDSPESRHVYLDDQRRQRYYVRVNNGTEEKDWLSEFAKS